MSKGYNACVNREGNEGITLNAERFEINFDFDTKIVRR